MTITEAVKAELQNVVAADDVIEKSLLDCNMNGASAYDSTLAPKVARVVIAVLQAVWGSQDISEGGFAISNRFTTIPGRISALAKKHGFNDVLRQMNPSVKSVRKW